MISGMVDGLGRAILSLVIAGSLLGAVILVLLYGLLKYIFSHPAIGWN